MIYRGNSEYEFSNGLVLTEEDLKTIFTDIALLHLDQTYNYVSKDFTRELFAIKREIEAHRKVLRQGKK